MEYPISYKRLSPGLYSVYLLGDFIGEVRLVNDAWFFRTFEEINPFVSSVPSPTCFFAIVQWSGFHYIVG